MALALSTALAAASSLPADAGPDTRSGERADRRQPKGETGFLTVSSTPPAKLLVDGSDTGKVTPVVRLELAVGKHKVTLVSLDGKVERSLGVQISKGEEKRLSVNL